MSVKEKAKAFEGHVSDDSDTHANASPPVPPPRKYKKNGTLKPTEDSSPSTERKENNPVISPPKPATNSSQPTKQSNGTEPKKKKPRPPPPPRGSSLGRASKPVVPANLQSGSGGKKPRPPIPPKPKNYVPKRKSLGRDAAMTNKVQQDIWSTKEKADSAPVVSDSGKSNVHGSQFYLNLEEGNHTDEIHPKLPDSKTSSQFFVPMDTHVPSETPAITGGKLSAVVTNTGDESVDSLENGRPDHRQFEVHENGVALPQTRSVFYDQRILSTDVDSGKEFPDLLEGLEIEVEALSDGDDEDFSEAALDSEGVGVVEASNNFGVVVKEQSYGELKSGDRGNDSKENVKVVFSLVLEEECSVSMIDNSVEGQKLVDFTVSETNNFEQTEEGESFDGISELSNETKHDVDHRLGDERVEVTTSQECEDVSKNIVAELLHTTDHDIENSPESCVQEMDVDSHSDRLGEDTQQNILEAASPDEEFCETTVEQKVAGDLHVHSELRENEFQKQERENDEVVTSTSTDLLQSEAHENREIIVAEPIREGTFISVSDHIISEGKADVVEETSNELSTNDETTVEVSDESETCVPISEIKAVTNTDIESPTNEGKDETEDVQEIGGGQIQSNLAEASSEVKSDDFEIEMDDEQKSGEHLLDAQANKGVADDSASKSEGSEELETEEILPAAVAECTLLETSEDVVVELSVDDFDHSPKSHENIEITATHVETVDNKEQPALEDDKTESETQPTSPEPMPPGRPNRKAKRGKYAYENVDILTSQVEKQADEKRSDSLARRAHSFSKYESVVHSLPRPVQRVSDDEAIYRVPSKVVPVQSYANHDVVYSLPFANPTRNVVEENEYSVPKPIVVKASAVTDRPKADEDGEVYAVPGLPTAVPVTEHSEKKVVTAVPQEGDSTYAVPGKQTNVPTVMATASAVPKGSNHSSPEHSKKRVVTELQQESDSTYVVPWRKTSVPTVTATASAVPPPKPPRLSLVFDQDKKEKAEVVKASSAESPKPVPRTRGAVSDASVEVKQHRGSPTPVPRKGNKTEGAESPTPKVKEQSASPIPAPRSGSKTEASESESKEQRASPSPVPRKGPKTPQTSESSESVKPQESGSPVPVPHGSLNALQYQEAAKVSAEEGKEEDGTPKRRSLPPPRPPPPVVRTSFANGEGTMLSPLVPGVGHDLESDSDSDVGEEEVPKGPPKPKTYHIAHEILSTERTFVDALKLVFEECYGTIKSANVVPDSVLADIFRDLENIYLLDSRFLQELEERMVTWEENERIGDIIKRYGHFLKMYTQYVNGYDKAMAVFQDTMKENAEFANLVTQFQASKRCHGMILSSYMLKPVQRIPSYRLLLIDYLKHLPKDSEEFKDTETTLKIVSEVATHINESMKKMDSFEQLLKLQNMLVGHPEIVKAGRDYLREGMLMKLCRKDMQERMFFLLTDVLLYTTPIGGNQFKLNKMLPLLGMQVTVPDSPDFVNEFSIISTTRSFTLTASTPEERDDWVEALNKAIDVVTKRKITFVSKTRDAAGLLEQEGDAAKLGEKAPVWIPDARVTMCMSCTKPFTVTNRRHHCRACGNVVCGSCSESTAPLAYLDYTQARVCDKCYDMLLKEFHTDEIHIDPEEPAALPPLLEETDNAEKFLRKPTKFEMMRRFKSRKTKKKLQILHPTHLTEVVANQEGIQMSGYLRCKKGRYGWKKSWFVLKDNVLYSYKASSDVVALDTLPVLGYTIADLGKEGDDFVFQLKHQGVPPIVFKADNETSAKRWTQELTKATTM